MRDLLVALNRAITNMNHTPCVLGDGGLVCHYDDRVALAMQLVEDRHDLYASRSVKVAGGLVGQKDRGIIN